MILREVRELHALDMLFIGCAPLSVAICASRAL
jgi:hypothetical protein